MTKTLFVFLLLFTSSFAQTYTNASLGVNVTMPPNWVPVPVLEINKPLSVYEALRDSNTRQFLTLSILPTADVEVNRSKAAQWAEPLLAIIKANMNDTLAADVIKYGNYKWYTVRSQFGSDNYLLVFSTIQNGFQYNFSFVGILDSTRFAFTNESESIVASCRFSFPEKIDSVKASFSTLQSDPVSGLKVPHGFSFATHVTSKQIPPYPFSIYTNLLDKKLTNYVLVADDYFSQLFCLNIALFKKPLDPQVITLINKIVVKQFEEQGNTYKEVANNPWPRSPSRVFYWKFTLTNSSGQQTTHYFYYILKKDRTDIIKIQLPSALEKHFEDFFGDWIYSNL